MRSDIEADARDPDLELQVGVQLEACCADRDPGRAGAGGQAEEVESPADDRDDVPGRGGRFSSRRVNPGSTWLPWLMN